MKYEICADEAWTHTSPPLNRYWCFYGGIFGAEADIDRLETALMAVRAAAQRPGEVKWASVSSQNVRYYNDLLDAFFEHLRVHDLHYRQFFTSREHIAVRDTDERETMSDLDVQFRLYYQFLKHCFGLQHLPPASTAAPHQILLRLDEHSSAKHRNRLMDHAGRLPTRFQPARNDLRIQTTFVRSQDFLRLQVCDLLMGAAGSYGNKKHEERKPGKRGMHETQRVRFELAQRIYNDLRAISCTERGTKAFNWFESTGRETQQDGLTHKVRIWKFLPRQYLVDKGWQRDHLGKGGTYLGPDISGEVFDAASRGR